MTCPGFEPGACIYLAALTTKSVIEVKARNGKRQSQGTDSLDTSRYVDITRVETYVVCNSYCNVWKDFTVTEHRRFLSSADFYNGNTVRCDERVLVITLDEHSKATSITRKR